MGFKDQATRPRLRVRKEVSSRREAEVCSGKEVWWSVLGRVR